MIAYTGGKFPDFFAGGMAQSVEHFVHIEGVVGSSPTVTTAKKVRTLTGESYTSTIGR